VARAAAEAGTLVLGVDANATGMARAASRAARRPERGGRPNARFLVCAVEALPEELAATADLVTVQFPRGSLLRGIVQGESAVVEPIARLLAPDIGRLRMLLSVEARDRTLGLAALDEAGGEAIVAAFERQGLRAIDLRAATPPDLAASGSTWAKRLGVGTGAARPAGSDPADRGSVARSAWLLELGRPSAVGLPADPASPADAGSRTDSAHRNRSVVPTPPASIGACSHPDPSSAPSGPITESSTG